MCGNTDSRPNGALSEVFLPTDVILPSGTGTGTGTGTDVTRKLQLGFVLLPNFADGELDFT